MAAAGSRRAGSTRWPSFCCASPTPALLAGATDVGLWVTKQHRRLDPVIYLGEVEELQRLEIGAEADRDRRGRDL